MPASVLVFAVRSFSRACFVFALLVACVGCGGVAEEATDSVGSELPGVSGEPFDTASRLATQAAAGSDAYEILRSLTVEVGPRPAGSEGDRRAVAWAEEKLQGLGFDEVWLEPVTVPHWERSREAGQILSPFPQPVILTALGGSVATPPDGTEAEVVRVESLDALDALDNAEVDGRIVFIDGGRMPAKATGEGYGPAVQPRVLGPSAAGAKGAVALLIRSAGSSTDRIAHTGSTRYETGVPRIPAAALSNPDADLLTEQVKAAEARGERARFRLELETRELPDATSYNVIADLRGRERPDQVVLLGAHLDSWDLATGAQDDGAGVAIVVEAARLIGELSPRPRRTVRVVLYANEEFGLAGARAYAEARGPEELAEHVAAAEADFGAGAVWAFRSRVDPADVEMAKQIASVLTPLGVDYGGNQARGGADLIPLAPHRVPVFDLTQDGTAYFDVHHTINDTLDKVDRGALDQNVGVYSAFAYLAAELPEAFQRGPEVERP
ncbi:MAG: M20/M25/M40 family metallo-hydrolase [Acidobacteriota bacterium]